MSLLRSLVLPVALFVTACAPSTMTVRAQPIDSYRAYGEYHPVAIDETIVKRSSTIVVGDYPVRIFQEALPEGVVLDPAGTLSVAPGYGHRLLGKYAYSQGKEESKDALVARVKQMCVATQANAAVILFGIVPSDHQDRAGAIEAVLMKLADVPAKVAPAEEPAPSHTL